LDVKFESNFGIAKMVAIVTNYAKIHIPIDDLIDRQAEILRLKKELDEAVLKLEQTQKQLSNQQFVTKAPKLVVDKIRETQINLQNKIESLNKIMKDM
jgi:valyl-tRNA synthetase